jgi:hypothetical protein
MLVFASGTYDILLMFWLGGELSKPQWEDIRCAKICSGIWSLSDEAWSWWVQVNSAPGKFGTWN